MLSGKYVCFFNHKPCENDAIDFPDYFNFQMEVSNVNKMMSKIYSIGLQDILKQHKYLNMHMLIVCNN